MRTLIVVENLSLDGVMQAPGRPDEDPRDGFTRGGWGTEALMDQPEAAQASMAAASSASTGSSGSTGSGRSAMLLGRRSYDDLCGYWLSTADPNPFADYFRDQTKYVASRTLTEPLPHPNSVLLPGDAVPAVREIKGDGDGTLVVLGSGDLVQQLAAADLVDEYVLTTVPVVLGGGRRLFADTPARLEAVSVQVFGPGITVGRYRVLRSA